MLALPSHKCLKSLEVLLSGYVCPSSTPADVAGVAMSCWLCVLREEGIQLLDAVFCLKIFLISLEEMELGSRS